MCSLFFNRIKCPSSFHFFGSEEKWTVQRETHLFRSCNTVPRAQNLKPKFEFQTPLAQKFPAGTSELIPFGANLDLCRNCPAGISEIFPFGASLDILWNLQFSEIPSLGLLLVSPRWGLPSLFVCVELHISPLGIYHSSPFLGNYIYYWQKICRDGKFILSVTFLNLVYQKYY